MSIGQTSEQKYITLDDIETLARLIMLERQLGKSLELHKYNFGSEEISDLLYMMPWEKTLQLKLSRVNFPVR